MLQGFSKRYPFLDNFTIRNKFVHKLGVIDGAYFTTAKFETLLNQFSAKRRDAGHIPSNCMNRSGFIEMCIRVAKYYYASSELNEANDKNLTEFQRLPISVALQLFIQKKLAPYYKKMKKPKVAQRYLCEALEMESKGAHPKQHVALTKLNICAINSMLGNHEEAVVKAKGAISDLMVSLRI